MFFIFFRLVIAAAKNPVGNGSKYLGESSQSTRDQGHNQPAACPALTRIGYSAEEKARATRPMLNGEKKWMIHFYFDGLYWFMNS